MEFVGTPALAFTVQTAATLSSKKGAPIAIGVILMVMVYIGAKISGAHYNPAITIAMFVRGKQDLAEGIQYIVAQVLGGCLVRRPFRPWCGAISRIQGPVSHTVRICARVRLQVLSWELS